MGQDSRMLRLGYVLQGSWFDSSTCTHQGKIRRQNEFTLFHLSGRRLTWQVNPTCDPQIFNISAQQLGTDTRLHGVLHLTEIEIIWENGSVWIQKPNSSCCLSVWEWVRTTKVFSLTISDILSFANGQHIQILSFPKDWHFLVHFATAQYPEDLFIELKRTFIKSHDLTGLWNDTEKSETIELQLLIDGLWCSLKDGVTESGVAWQDCPSNTLVGHENGHMLLWTRTLNMGLIA
eukprot:c2592_g1_i1.p1 GENE.c2592_g1_i1~~c2592_g1_i1.p1  ORF type:complete len:234 (-),score=24.31 c2592_g1_i1:60-761(-)